MQVGDFRRGKLVIAVFHPLEIFAPNGHGFDRKLADHKDHDVFLIDGSSRNIWDKGRKGVRFYLIEPLWDCLVAEMNADNLSGICDTDKNMPALCIGESGKRFNRSLIEGGFELDRFGFAFFYEIQDGFFVHYPILLLSIHQPALSAFSCI